MLNCPKCSQANCTKDGIVKGKQRYKCKGCGYRYTVTHKGASKDVKRQALNLYLEGLGFRSIGRILNFSHVAVYNWIKVFGEKLEDLKSDTVVEVVEIDEMHSYVGSKKTTVGSGLLLIELGENSSTVLLATEARLREKNYGTH
jgi:transposase-like protein